MAVKIRLKRMGRKKRPFYRLVAIDSRKRRDGLEIERLGWYNPVQDNLSCEMKEDRIFSYENAKNDFGYSPMNFKYGILREVNELKHKLDD